MDKNKTDSGEGAEYENKNCNAHAVSRRLTTTHHALIIEYIQSK